MTVLVTPQVQADGGPVLVEALRERRPEMDLVHAETEDELRAAAPDSEIVVTGRIPDELLPEGESLRWIQLLSAGYDFVDVDAVAEREIALTNASGIHTKPIGQQVLGYLLFFERGFDHAVAQQRRREWERWLGRELGDRTVGILGVGAIGGEVAKYCDVFGTRVLGVKRDTSEVPEGVDELYAPAELDRVLAESDYLVIACPLTDETRGLIDADALATLPDHARVVNIARGEVVDEEAMIAALERDELGGAALDVFQEEPLPEDSPLWEREDVLVTPHMAGSTPHYFERAAELFLENLDLWRAGEDLRNRIV